MSNLISATFKTREAVIVVLEKLEEIGIDEKQVSMVVADDTTGNSFNLETHSRAGEGTAIGGTAGGLIGGILGALSTGAAIALPGVNIIVAGIVISTLAGVGAGALTGGLVGALIGAGIPEHEAKIYEDEIRNGSILLAVQPDNKEKIDEIKNILDHSDAHNITA